MDSSLMRPDAADLRATIAKIVDDASGLLDRDLSGTRLTSAESGNPRLGDVWDLVTSEMLRAADAGDPSGRTASLIGLLGRIRDAESTAARLRLSDRTRVLSRVRAALAELSGAKTVDGLLASAPEAVCGLGFDRALVSTVDNVWRLHTMCVVRDARWAEEIVAVGRQSPPVLDRSLVENDTVVGARAVLVQEVQDNPRVNRPLAKVTKSSSYGIAPLLVDGEVVGLVHGDCYHQRRALTDVDRTVLSTFAEGLSNNLARVTVLEGMSAIRDQLDGATRWRVPAPGLAESVALSRDDDSVLTRREVQIVRSLAAGDSNGKIARRFAISEGTVKTHITRILRKLGAANRAEAVSIWLRGSDTAGSVPRG